MLEKKVLIIPTEELDPDILAAAFSIARAISTKEKIRAEVLLDKNKIPAHLEKIFPYKDIRFTTEIEPQGFVVKLKSIDAKIKDIKWEEKDGEINLYIAAENGKLDRKASVRSGGTNYEKIVLIGVKKLEDLGELYLKNNDLFDSVTLINIDTSVHNTNYGNNAYVKPEASSVSEIAFSYLLEEGVEVSGKEATDLLSGIFWKTKSFQVGFNKSSTFQICTDLINLNADVSTAMKQVYQTLNLAQTRFLTEILKNVEVSPDGIAWSLIRKSMLNSLKINEITFPQINLISYLENIKVAFVLIETAEGKVHCELKSNQKGTKASRIAAAFGSTGSSQYASFGINSTIENAKIQLINEIRGTESSFIKSGEAVKLREEKKSEQETDLDEEATLLPAKEETEPAPTTPTAPTEEEPQNTAAPITPQENEDKPLYDPLPPATAPPIDI